MMNSDSDTKLSTSKRSAKDVIKKVKRIELATNSLVNSLICGAYKSRFKGQGIEFSEVREYRVGDDVRTIDWNVTARMGHPFVKEFIEERDLCVYVVFDVSGSLDFGTQNAFKKDVGLELIASIAFACLKNNDRIGLVLSTDRVERCFPAKKGKRHVLRMINALSSFEPVGKGTDLRAAMGYLSKILKRKSIIFLISDFMDDISRIEVPLKMMSCRHDVIAVSIEDLREIVMPDVGGLIELEDEETGEQLTIDTTDASFLEEYSRLVACQRSDFHRMLRKHKVDLVEVNTKDSWIKPIIAYFHKKKHRKNDRKNRQGFV
ncbi:MAG: DUF58 domain-containing protein [archaeon]